MMLQGKEGYTDGQFIAGEHASALGGAECTPIDANRENGTSDSFESIATIEGGSSMVVSTVTTPTSSTPTASATSRATSATQPALAITIAKAAQSTGAVSYTRSVG